MTDEPLLDVRGLTVEFEVDDERLRAVDDVSFVVRRGEIVGLVGESGAGKSLTSEAILGLIPRPPGRVTGEVRFRGRNLLALDEPALARIRGKDIAMIFQNPTGSRIPCSASATSSMRRWPCIWPTRDARSGRGRRRFSPASGFHRRPAGCATIRTSSAAAWPSA